jgi:cell division protein FtsA
MNTPLVALDVGATKVACAIGLPHERSTGFELMGSSLVPYPALTEAWLADPLLVGHTVEQALEASGVTAEVHRALVTVNHPALMSERTRVVMTLADEPVTVRSHDLDRLQTHAVNQVLGIDRDPLMVEPVTFSGNGFEGVRDPRGLSATRLVGTYHIVTIPVAARRALVQAVESAGLEVARLTYTLPAVWASVSDEPLRRKRALLVDVGGLATDLGLFSEGTLLDSTSLPWGGLTLAATIAKKFQVTMDQAIAWSREGTTCRRDEVRTLIEQHWGAITKALDRLRKDQPRPDAILVSGRGALMDGLAEWIERATEIPTVLGRSARTSTLSDLSRQVGLSAAIGMLELATRTSAGPVVGRSSHRLTRLLDRTRTILTEYF